MRKGSRLSPEILWALWGACGADGSATRTADSSPFAPVTTSAAAGTRIPAIPTPSSRASRCTGEPARHSSRHTTETSGIPSKNQNHHCRGYGYCCHRRTLFHWNADAAGYPECRYRHIGLHDPDASDHDCPCGNDRSDHHETPPTQTPEPFPNALPLGTWFNFSSGKTASQATVYEKWINETYTWHNDMDNKWYTQKPKAGNKYLLVFINMVNRGDTRVWFPKSGVIAVHYDNKVYYADPTHYIPDKSGGNLKATPIEIAEVQYYHKLFGAEYVEDYGLSHGTMSDFIYPGESNAVDGTLFTKPFSSRKVYLRSPCVPDTRQNLC